MNIAMALDDCLTRLTRGESVADCLTRYPSQAAELAPMLTAAVQLRTLSIYQLSGAQRLRGKVALRTALAARAQPRPWLSWLSWLGSNLRSPALAAAAALFLFVALSAGAVAASQPGDLAYGVRVVIERAPALVLFDADDRAARELDIADRRLADLRNAQQGANQADPTALQALVHGDEAAATAASNLSEEQRGLVAERVETHAATLARLAAAAREEAAAVSLAHAAARASEIAARLRTPPPQDHRPGSTGPAEVTPERRTPAPPTPSATSHPELPATTTPTVEVTPEATLDSPSGTPSPVSAPSRPPTASATPRLPPPAETRSERATEIAATALARPTRTPLPSTRTPPPPLATRRA
ncbi:MAG: hypothetical protein QG637_413, partial [Chloroflexota bacterium]|nr:hypothetical protein [Chloroflexota bacterium]